MDRLKTPLTDLLGIKYPILLAGMSLGMDDRMPSPPRLAAAVTEAGGLGVMGCGSRKPDTIDRCIREFKQLSSGPLGIDLLLPATMAEMGAQDTKAMVRERLERDHPQHVGFVKELMQEHNLPDVPPTDDDAEAMSPDLLRRQFEVVADHNVPVFVAGLGDPAMIMDVARAHGMKVGGVVGAVRHAQRQKAAGVDFMIAQGTEAGGHTGNIATFPLVPQVAETAAPTPILAAGGVGSGRQIAAAMALGAQGVWIGSAFLVAEENAIPEEHQNQILGARSEDFTLSRYSSGKQARSYKTPIKEAWANSGMEPLPMPLQGILMEPLQAGARAAGRLDIDAASAGQVGGMLKARRPARDILLDMVNEAEETIERMQGNLR
ncbi:MAG: nitronate monooxygenase [Dehalococcoidia bacterium]|nr:nitronate monooxygenase [Dehalococcoidia bacterium]